MQAINGIQNANLNTNTAAQAGLVVDAANAHRMERSYVELPVSMHSHFGADPASTVPVEVTGKPVDTGKPGTTDGQGTCRWTSSRRDRTWRLDQRQLPEAAWAMLVLSRSLCG